MTKIIAAISRLLTPPDNGTFDKSEDVFKKYIAVSLLIHLVLIIVLSISYTRSIKTAVPVGPYEVSLIQMEEPKPKPAATQRATTKKPEPKRTEPEPKAVVPEEKKEEEVVQIKPEVKKPEVKKPEKKPEQKPETKPKKPEDTVEKAPETKPQAEPEKPKSSETAPDSLLADKTDSTPSPSVGSFQVDNPNFNFNYYLAMLRDKIQSNWRPPSGLPTKEGGFSAVVRFTIRRDGTITGADVEETSGLRFFDQSALRAVVNSNPAPPLPRAYDEDRLGVHVSFVFSKENR